MDLGIYESLITDTLKSRVDSIDRNEFYIADQKKLDADEAVHVLPMHLGVAIKNALKLIKAEKKDLLVAKQIENHQLCSSISYVDTTRKDCLCRFTDFALNW